MYPAPTSGPSTPARLYQPPPPAQPQASTSYQHFSPHQAIANQHLSPHTPRAYYPPYRPAMDPAYPSHGASPQTDYAPSTPHFRQTSGSQPGSVGSNAAGRTWMPPGSLPPAPAPFDASMPPSTIIPLPPSTVPTAAPTPAAPVPYVPDHQIIVHETTVMQGSPGAEFTVKCELSLPASTPSSPSFSADHSPRRDRAVRILFGSHPVPTTVTQIQDPLSSTQLVHLKAQVPGWTLVATSASGNRVPVSIQILVGGQEVVGSVMLGEYSYLSFTSGSRVPSYGGYGGPSAPSSLKRAGESLESHRPSPNSFAHRRMMSTGLKYESASPEVGGHTALPGSTYAGPGMPNDAYSSPHHNLYGASSGAGGGPGGFPMPGQPNLQRATQLPAPAPVSPFPTSGGSKASLELVGDLNNMAKGWTTDEWTNKRRLVQFWRKQEGTQITAAFQPISQEKYSAHTQSIIISCIFREDNNLCYVTSVDAIYLLEALVGNRFTVEEKNRIRRNLEGFRPLTVSKSKPGSEDFFKVIMGFPNPKPRNIEKDVKVFPWDILGQALKKIIGKYSASYPGAVSPALSASSVLPYAPTFSTQPTPLQPVEGAPHPMHSYNSSSSESVPTLTTTSSTDSNAFSSTSSGYDSHHDSTPHISHMAHPLAHSLPQSQSHPHAHAMHVPHPASAVNSPKHHGHGHYRSTPVPHEKSHHHAAGYVNVSPSPMASYTGATTYYPGMNEIHSPGTEASIAASGAGGGAVGTGGPPSGYSVPHGMPSPYLTQQGGHPGMGDHAQPPHPHGHGHPPMHHPAHQLPHVHQTIERQPSSNDLRVMYPGMAQ